MKMRCSLAARSVAACLAALTAFAVLGGSAGATPPGLVDRGGDSFVCEGRDVVVFGGNGRSGWIGDTLYVATEIHVTATFTPTGGGDPVVFTFDNTYGKGPRGEPITCTTSFTDSTPDGTVVGNVMVNAVKVPGR